MTYYTSKCPHCGEIIKLHSRHKTSAGCPVKICTHCGQSFVDPYCYEQAFKPYKRTSKLRYCLAALSYSAAIPGVLFILLANFTKLDYSTVGIICGALWLVLFCILLPMLLKKYDSIEAEFLQEWHESDLRLRDPEYVKRLVNAGFKVPVTYTYGVQFDTPVDSYSVPPDPHKFVCSVCGKYNSGWYQVCPNCGAKGKMKQTPKEAPPSKKTILPEKNAPKKIKVFVCRSCGKASSGWYQNCPNCGAVGKMEVVYATLPPEDRP